MAMLLGERNRCYKYGEVGLYDFHLMPIYSSYTLVSISSSSASIYFLPITYRNNKVKHMTTTAKRCQRNQWTVRLSLVDPNFCLSER